MRKSCQLFSPLSLAKVALFVGLTVVSLLPFSGALEIHHAFAEVDHDGHEHSEFDLCQWMQQHSNGLSALEKPLADVFPLVVEESKCFSTLSYDSNLGLTIPSPRPPPRPSLSLI